MFKYVSLFHSNRESYKSITSTPDHNHISICNNIKNQITGNFSFFFTCIKIIQYLKHINNQYVNKNPIDKCEFLNYWINSKINDIKPGDDNNSIIFDGIISEFRKKLTSEINICLKSMKYINKNELKDLKILMDLFGDFEKFKAINKEREINCSIGDKCVTSYMSSLDKCQDNNNIEFCKILYVFYKYYNEQARNIKHCKNVEKYLPPVSEYFNPLQYEGTADTYEEIEDTYEEIEDTYEVTEDSQEVSAASPAFTPLQSWIRPQIVEKKKLLKNLQEENFKLQENYKINESDTRNNGFNLSYNAALN
ncbi:hypothetical protein PVNG_01538 [Plasmodium vivax North Korean]|uniref:Uncharacterized protein n=1 Tax=Plasmodium vivax North Korean TaxID=1035514 RepID=A0A0J9WFG8_PLAVI|nr:hypothetical protein PVNG_01538 [Plasmodium vivax North Korean]